MQPIENVVIEHPEDYALLARVTPSEFAFCIYELSSKSVSLYNSVSLSDETNIHDSIRHIVLDSEFLTLPYASIHAIYVSKNFDLVPQYLVQKDKKEELYNFTHTTPARHIMYSPVNIRQVVTVFDVEPGIYEFLSRNLSNPDFHHHTNVLMRYMERRNQLKSMLPCMYLNFHDDFTDVFCYGDKGQILHAITFEAENEMTLAYYLLNIWEKSGFDQLVTPVYVLDGYRVPNMFVTSKLREYIRHVEDISVPLELNAIQSKNELKTPLPLDLLILSAL
jgi:hypothetical protein